MEIMLKIPLEGSIEERIIVMKETSNNLGTIFYSMMRILKGIGFDEKDIKKIVLHSATNIIKNGEL